MVSLASACNQRNIESLRPAKTRACSQGKGLACLQDVRCIRPKPAFRVECPRVLEILGVHASSEWIRANSGLY